MQMTSMMIIPIFQSDVSRVNASEVCQTSVLNKEKLEFRYAENAESQKNRKIFEYHSVKKKKMFKIRHLEK